MHGFVTGINVFLRYKAAMTNERTPLYKRPARLCAFGSQVTAG
jgi:hypothetical protein